MAVHTAPRVLKPKRPRKPGALPEHRWLDGEVRTALSSAVFPWSGEPRAVPCVRAAAPEPPPRSIPTCWQHRPTARATAPHSYGASRARTRPHPPASSHSMRTQRAFAKCTPVLTPRTRTACTRKVHKDPHAAGAYLMHLQCVH